MKQLILPGIPVNQCDVFSLEPGMQVLDKRTGKKGVITKIDEGAPECIEAFVKMEGDPKEYKAYQFSQLIILG